MYKSKLEKIVANFYSVTKTKITGKKFSQDCIVLFIEEKLRTPNVYLLYYGIMKNYTIVLEKDNISRAITYFIKKFWKDFNLFDECPSNWEFIKTIAEHIAMNLLDEID